MNLKLIKKLCSLPQNELIKLLYQYLKKKNYTNVQYDGMNLIAEGELPVCLIAHMDTVFNYLPHEFFYDNQKRVLWAPGGAGFDDRTGIYIILTILDNGFKPSIIFTDKEECGGEGSEHLIKTFPQCPFKNCRALIQLDRANKDDCVFYNCDNIKFEKYISKFGFKYNWGTFSDISIIAPKWKIAATNLSVGYVDEHTQSTALL